MRHKKEIAIPAEKIAVIAEKGLKAARLSNAEKEELFMHGLDEIYWVKKFNNTQIAPAGEDIVNTILARFFPAVKESTLAIKIRDYTLEMVQDFLGWHTVSPVFAVRGPSSNDRISFFKESGRLGVHIEVVKRNSRNADLNFKISDETGRDRTSFNVELIANDRYIENVSAPKSETVSINAVNAGEYSIRISDNKGLITAFSLRVDS